jgi:RimJ/RimL family protein N-acetyltransferase
MLNFRKPTIADMEIFFSWANDPVVRKQSYESSILDFERHKKWFESALNNESYFMCIFQNSDGEDIGQVRIQKQQDNEAVIGISIDFKHRGKGFAKELLKLATESFLKSNSNYLINAYIKEANLDSKFAFEKAGFKFIDTIMYKNYKSYHFIKK